MKRALILAPALVAALALAGPSFGMPTDQSSRHSSESLPTFALRTLDSRLAQIVLSEREQGAGAALAAARAQGFLVAQGKIRVIVQARSGQAAGARSAVRLADGTLLVTTGKLIEALVPPASLRALASSKHVVGVRPVKAAATRTVTGLRLGTVKLTKVAGRKTFAVELSFHAASVPAAPTEVAAEAGDGEAMITFTPPASDGGDEILYYEATAYPGGQTASATGGAITVTGLTNGVEYTFTVRATNSVGSGPESDLSNTVVPEGSLRLVPDPPAASPRPAIPRFTVPSGGRVRPHHGGGEF